ncbi:MAG: CRISPR-associated endonuclease Cas2 [Solirubrobacterales bacterium]|nr:CRISPR-associated endonuclease Cas2 [Solirubrobacterales bacterium]
MESRPMWILLMFDLPVVTKTQRTEANRFRNDLIADGYQRVQWSIYARFCPTVQKAKRDGKAALGKLPPQGECRVLYLTEHQWHRMVVVQHKNRANPEPEPQQLAIFGPSEDAETPANA